MDAYSTNVPFFQECLLGISEMATMLRYNVLITIGTPNDISNVQRLVEKKQVDGIVLLRDLEHDRLLQYLTEIHFPAGLSGTCDYEEIIQVDIDNRFKQSGFPADRSGLPQIRNAFRGNVFPGEPETLSGLL